jgi:hypothetical protein
MKQIDIRKIVFLSELVASPTLREIHAQIQLAIKEFLYYELKIPIANEALLIKRTVHEAN